MESRPHRGARPVQGAAALQVFIRALLFPGLCLFLPACGTDGTSDSGSSEQAGDPEIETFPDEGRDHVPVGTVVVYHTDPPTSGNHYPIPQPGGFYKEPIEAGYLVHSMEHGGVIIYYDPQWVSKAERGRLKALAELHPGTFSQVVAVPRSDATFPVILTAWTHWLRLHDYDDARIQGFVDLLLGHGPEN